MKQPEELFQVLPPHVTPYKMLMFYYYFFKFLQED